MWYVEKVRCPFFDRNVALEDAIGSHAFAPLEPRPGMWPMEFFSGAHSTHGRRGDAFNSVNLVQTLEVLLACDTRANLSGVNFSHACDCGFCRKTEGKGGHFGIGGGLVVFGGGGGGDA
jgi:hypothetical protein